MSATGELSTLTAAGLVLATFAAFADPVHVDAEVESVRGKVWTLALIARDASGRERPDVEADVALRLNKSARGAILGTNVVRLVAGRAEVRVRKDSAEGNTVLVPEPLDRSIAGNECYLQRPEEYPGVWVRDPNGGVPQEVPEAWVTNSFRVQVRTERDFNWFDDPREPLALSVLYSNRSDVVRSVRCRCWARDWDGRLALDRARDLRMAPHGVASENLSFDPPEERGIYFIEASVTDAETEEEAFTRTQIVRLPPHAFASKPEESIFGIAASWQFPSAEKVQRLMDRLGVRWMRSADARVQHPGRLANYHNNLGDWDHADWPEKHMENWVVREMEHCIAHGNAYYEFGNELNLRGLEIGRTMAGIGQAERAKVYSKWVKVFRRVMRERGYDRKVKLLGFGMAGFDLAFANVMRDSGALDCLDGFCLHAANSQYAPDYPFGLQNAGPVERDRGAHPDEGWPKGHYWNFFGTVRACRDYLAKYRDMPLWVTEVYSSTYPNFKWGASMRDSADNVVLEYALLASEDVRVGMFYQLHDGIGRDRLGVNPKDREYSFGILNRDLSFKPLALGYCAIAEALDGASPRGWMKFDDPKAHGILFATPRGPMAVMWGRWDGLWLTQEPKDGHPCRHREAWVDRWPTKRTFEFPAFGRVRRIDSIGRSREIEVRDGRAKIVLDGSPCIVYGLGDVPTVGRGEGGIAGRLAEARAACAKLEDDVRRLEAKGCGQYARMRLEVARWCLDGMEKEELPRGWTNRVERELKELEQVFAGEPSAFAVPRFRSGGNVRADGALMRGDRVWPDGRVERDVPLIWTGWGHFRRAQEEVAVLERMGFNFLQMESGLYKFLPRGGVTNEQAIAEFRTVADRAYAANTRVDFLLSPHYLPGWVTSLVPKDNGVCRNGFIKCCIHCPAVSDAMARYCAVAAGAAKDHPALHAFTLTNEPHSGGIQECREVRRQWAGHLKAKFGTVEALNAAWRTSYGRFEDVELQAFPDLRQTPAALEYVRFGRSLTTAFHAKLLAAARAAAPDRPFHSKVVANEEFLGRKFSTFWSVDLRDFARMFDYLDNDSLCFHLDDPKARCAARWQENEAAYDFLRSFAVKPTVNGENHNIVDKCRGEVPPEHVYASLWQNAVHGQTATALWCWERGLSKDSIMIGLAPEHPNCLEALGRCSLDLQRLSAELAPIQAQRPTVLVLRSLSSAVLGSEGEGRATLAAYAAASFLGETVGFLTDEALAEFASDGIRRLPLDTARVILLPSVTHLPRPAIAALRKLEKQGIAVLAVGEPLRSDDCGRPLKADSPWPCVAGADDEEIFRALVARMPAFGLDAKPRPVRPVFGVEAHGSAQDGVRRLTLCNQLRASVTVELESAGVDLISGKGTARSLVLPPRQPVFVEFGK